MKRKSPITFIHYCFACYCTNKFFRIWFIHYLQQIINSFIIGWNISEHLPYSCAMIAADSKNIIGKKVVNKYIMFFKIIIIDIYE